MKTLEPINEASEGMSLVYLLGENLIYQAIFTTEKFGTFTRFNNKWRGLSPNDTSLENLSIMDISPKYYKVVTGMFDAAQKSGYPLKCEDVAQYEIPQRIEQGDRE